MRRGRQWGRLWRNCGGLDRESDRKLRDRYDVAGAFALQFISLKEVLPDYDSIRLLFPLAAGVFSFRFFLRLFLFGAGRGEIAAYVE